MIARFSSTELKAQRALTMIITFETDTVTSALQSLLVTHFFLKKPCEADTIFPNLQNRKVRHDNIPEHDSIHRTGYVVKLHWSCDGSS